MKRIDMTRVIAVVSMATGVLATCAPEGGTTLQILRAIIPTATTCTVALTGLTMPGGQFDPSGASAYVLPLLLRNNADAETTDPSNGFNKQNTRPRTNDILLTSFEACWYRAAEQGQSGDIVECNSLPSAQRGTVSEAATIERQTSATVSPLVLTPEHLQGLYGPDFDASLIPSLGISSNGTLLSYAPEDPSSNTRSAAWGTYPTQYTDEVIVQLRANGVMQGGSKVKSNWFRFPIELCIGCFGRCSAVSKTRCAPDQCAGTPPSLCNNPCGNDVCDNGTCPDGSSCGDAELCPDGASLCFPIRDVFPSTTIDFTGTCLPFQNISGTVRPKCTNSDPCATFLD